MPASHAAGCWCEALKLVAPRWRGEFTRLVEEGEATAAFLEHFESDPECIRAFEMLMRADRDTPRRLAELER